MGASSAAARVFRILAAPFSRLARALEAAEVRSRLVEAGVPRSLYRTRSGQLFWLDPSSYMDRCIADQGVFETDAVAVMQRLVQPGHTVLDVGANIGFHTVLLSRLVGPKGRVHAFEPTARYRSILERNVRANSLDNVAIHPFGLSDRSAVRTIQIGESSATLHAPGPAEVRAHEEIELVRLDDLEPRLGLSRLDFIKVDVDGHEPAFLHGAERVLERWAPPVLLEVSHLHYLEAGWTAWDFYRELKKQGYLVYDEGGLVEIRSETDFLIRCGNFRESRNIVISREPLPAELEGTVR